jgi:glucose-6-phosphate dehydrogenase assembly protein OpcA
MAAAVVERTWRESTPEGVERDLAALWRELAGRGGIARAVMSNLIVFRLHDRRRSRRPDAPGVPGGSDVPDVLDTIDSVVARHPSRTIVIEHDRGDHNLSAPVGARVGVTVFGPPTAQYAVERVVIRSACAEMSLPSIVRRFVRGDVPTSVWWMEDLSRVKPLPALVGTGRQFLFDSRRWRDVGGGIRALAPLLATGRIDLSDLNWRRLAPMRLALEHATGSMSTVRDVSDRPDVPDRPDSEVRIAHRPGEAPLAALLAGWLVARLGWSSDRWPAIDEVSSDAAGSDVLSLRIGEGAETLTATLDEHRVRVEQPRTPALVVAVPRSVEAESVAAELRALSVDRALRDALVALVRRYALA